VERDATVGGVRRAGRVDLTQADTVKRLRQIGASVAVTSQLGGGFPDLVVGFRGRTFLLEMKTGNEPLTEVEKTFHAKWAGHLVIARTAEEAQIAVIKGAA
jgi:hypothetical protein